MSIEKRPVDVARAAGFSVHLFTASGGAVAVLALYAAIERNFAACFAWLGWRSSSTASTARLPGPHGCR